MSTAIADFDHELKTLTETKLPISASKIQSLTKAALKCAKHYKELVHSLEKYLQNCPTPYKLPAIYVIDSISRVCRKDRTDKYRDALVQRIESKLRGLFGMAALCTGKDRERLKRLLDVWQKNRIFSDDALAPLPDLLESLAPVAEDAGEEVPSKSKSKDSQGSSRKEKKKEVVEHQEPIAPPALDVSDPHAQAMMASLFSMMAPSTNQNGTEAKASKAAATISNILSTSLGMGNSEDSLLDYDDMGASSSSELEDNTAEDDDITNPSKVSKLNEKKSSSDSTLITPEEQMRSLLTAAQSVLPATSKSTSLPPPPTHQIHAQIPLPAFLNPNEAPTIPLPPQQQQQQAGTAPVPTMFIPPTAIMMNPLALFGGGGYGAVQPQPPPIMHTHPTIPSSASSNPMMEQMRREVLGDVVSRAGRIRKIDAHLSPDCIRVLTRTLFLGSIPEDVTEEQLYALFGKYDPDAITITPQSRTVFIKFRTRNLAEMAREELGNLKLGDQDIRINWACGFGSRDLFERQPGWSTIPVSQLTDSERRNLTQEIGPEFLSKHTQLITKGPPVQSERDYWFGGIFCEEPDTVIRKRPRDNEDVDDPRRQRK